LFQVLAGRVAIAASKLGFSNEAGVLGFAIDRGRRRQRFVKQRKSFIELAARDEHGSAGASNVGMPSVRFHGLLGIRVRFGKQFGVSNKDIRVGDAIQRERPRSRVLLADLQELDVTRARGFVVAGDERRESIPNREFIAVWIGGQARLVAKPKMPIPKL